MLIGTDPDGNSYSELGFSLNPLKAVKAVGHGVAKGVKATGHGVAVGARATGHGVAVGAKAAGHGAVVVAKTVKNIAMAPLNLLLKPVRSRIRTLQTRRANKIAWDKRKSRTPTAAEQAEAKAWVKSELKKKPPHGTLLATFAGAMPRNPNPGELGIAPAVIAALIPVFMVILQNLLKQFASNGQAPVAIGPDGQPILPPGVDPSQPDAAVEAMVAAEAAANPGPVDDGSGGGPGGDAGGGDDGSGGGGGGLPAGVNKNHLMIGGAILLGIAVVMMMKKKKE